MYSRMSDFTRCCLATSGVWGTENLVCLCIIVRMQILDFSTRLTTIFSGCSTCHFRFLPGLQMLTKSWGRAGQNLVAASWGPSLEFRPYFGSVHLNDWMSTSCSPRPERLACQRHGFPRCWMPLFKGLKNTECRLLITHLPLWVGPVKMDKQPLVRRGGLSLTRGSCLICLIMINAVWAGY